MIPRRTAWRPFCFSPPPTHKNNKKNISSWCSPIRKTPYTYTHTHTQMWNSTTKHDTCPFTFPIEQVFISNKCIKINIDKRNSARTGFLFFFLFLNSWWCFRECSFRLYSKREIRKKTNKRNIYFVFICALFFYQLSWDSIPHLKKITNKATKQPRSNQKKKKCERERET